MPITTTPSGGPQGEFSTYTPIYAQTLSGAVSSITFSNIPTTYTDLVIAGSYQFTGAILDDFYLRFNSNTATNYSWTWMRGNGSVTLSQRGSNKTAIQIGVVSSTTVQNQIIQIQNYYNTTNSKSLLSRNNNASFATYAHSGLWRQSSAITSVTLAYLGAANAYFNTLSTFTLYGIKAA
jgi:hypothetical protein